MTSSEAVRTALREAAARRRARSAMRAEAQRVAADEADREEMRIIREQLADLAPRSTIRLHGEDTRVLVEQSTVVDPQRLGRSAGRLDAGEMRAVDDALTLIFGL